MIDLPPGSEQLVLLTPGPVMISTRVRRALAHADFSHRDPVFSRLLADAASRLVRLAHASRHEALLLAGGGTAATEAAFTTLLPRDQTVLVISNGAFGERLAELARAVGVPVHHLRYNWAEPISLDEVSRTLAADPAIRAVAVVHHDTSVGCLNPVREIGELAASFDASFFVDVVSSFGAELFDADEAHASAIIGTTNKCLHAVPGLSFVLVREDQWKRVAGLRPPSMYLDLWRYRPVSGDGPGIPFTPAVHVAAALAEALVELEEGGGIQARRRRYQHLNERVRDGLRARGMDILFTDVDRASSVTLASLPAGFTIETWYELLRCRGFLVYKAKGELRDRSFLVANMGALDPAMIDGFLETVGTLVEARVMGAGSGAARPPDRLRHRSPSMNRD
jgi:2-aminoethylphosphonate-pyruvate transaminase